MLASWRHVGGIWLALGMSPFAYAISVSPFADTAQVVAGNQHTCALTNTAQVWCWGSNAINQLGVADHSVLTVRTTPVPVPGLAGIRHLASGSAHTCAVTTDRSVVCWGLNDFGQSGDAELTYSVAPPRLVAGLAQSVQQLAAGQNHSCARHTDGQVSCWGGDALGQLGNGDAESAHADAQAVQGIGGAASFIAAGVNHSCAVLGDGSVKCWGDNRAGQLGDGSTTQGNLPVVVQGLPGSVRSLAVATDSTCAVTSAGALYCWGAQYPLLAFEGGSLVASAYPGFDTGVLSVAAGAHHFCALLEDNRIRCFGENAFGQFGSGPIDGSLEADGAVELAADIVEVAAGGQHTCARGDSGSLQCWGDNRFGQLGINSTSLRLTPVPVSGLDSDVADVGIGNYHGCALSELGAVSCWGANGAQQVGDGSTALRLTPVAVPALASGVRALATGTDSNCAITEQRRVMCWGANYSGQLGIGPQPDTAPPTAVVGLGDVDVLAVGVGREHACALLADGTVKCWGSNVYGQLGDGTTESHDTAVDVIDLGTGIRSIGVGYLHTCAITDSGGLKCWGFNENGQLGDGSTTQRNSPVDVQGLSSGVAAVGPGGLHTCALLSNGAVQCWGANYFGLLLGDGSDTDRLVPGDVPALGDNVVELAVSLFGTCARLDSGTMQCWGTNDGGAVGDNSTVSRPLPTEVAGLSRGVTAMGAGYGLGGHTCAVVFGAAKCWGENTFAQLGDGSTHGVPTPQTVVSNAIARRVSALTASLGSEPDRVQLDASGRFVLLVSEASDLDGSDSNGSPDVFLFDRERRNARRVSLDDDGAQIEGTSSAPSMSADARLVVFVAPDAAVDKVHGESTKQAAARRKGASQSVYLRDLLTGSTQRVGAASTSAAAPQISASGNTIVYTAPVADASEGAADQDNVYAVSVSFGSDNMPTLSPPACATCKPGSSNGANGTENADGASGQAALSADGQWLAFTTEAKNGVADQASPCPASGSEVLLHNLLTGSTQRISPPPNSDSSQCGSAGSSNPSIDFSGTVIAVQTDQSLVEADGNDRLDVYVFPTVGDAPIRVSQAGPEQDSNGVSSAPKLSGDGTQITFVSTASNLDLSFADNNDSADVHGARVGGSPTRLSLSTSGAEANGSSSVPALNFDGSQIAFVSVASLLTGQAGAPALLARENPQAPLQRTAIWWIPQESSWGLTVFDQGNLLAPIWFTYDDDGEPTWFLVGGAFPQADGSYRGDLYRYTGTPLLQIQGPATQSFTPIGSTTLTYIGEDVLDFSYSVEGITQSKTLSKFPFGLRDFTCTASPDISRASAINYSDLWTGATTNAGWGMAMYHVDDLVVAIWYTYDTDGEAVFFVVNTTRQADGSFTGQVFRQRDGIPYSLIDGSEPSSASDEIGTASFRFVDGEHADFTYTIDGTTQSRGIVRLVVGDLTQVCRTTSINGD